MNIIKKINWKARIKNPVFWTTVIPAAVSFVYCVLGAFGIVPALTESMVLNVTSAIITMLTTLGVLNLRFRPGDDLRCAEKGL